MVRRFFSSFLLLLTPLLQVQLPKDSCTISAAVVFQPTPVESSQTFTVCHRKPHISVYDLQEGIIHENTGACSAVPLSYPYHHAFNILPLAKDVAQLEILL